MSKLKVEIDDGQLNFDVGVFLRDLRRIDPDLRREVPDKIKNTAGAQGLLADVKARQPLQPTTGWHVGPSRKTGPGRLNWSTGKIRQQITLQFRGTRPRGAPVGSWPVLRVRSANAAQNIFELAGARGDYKPPKARGQALAQYLKLYHGKPASRTVWPAVERWARSIEDEIEDIFDDYAKTVNRRQKAR